MSARDAVVATHTGQTTDGKEFYSMVVFQQFGSSSVSMSLAGIQPSPFQPRCPYFNA